MSKPPAPVPDAVDRRRQLDAQRLARYDHEVAVLVAFLRAVASRIEASAVADTDAARLRQEAERLARCLPADLPVYPLRGDGPR